MGRWLLKLLTIVFAIFLLAVCVNMFLAPHHIAAGGVTGLGIILEQLFGFDRSLVILICNAALLVVTFIFLDRQVFFNTVIGALLLPVAIGLVPHVTLIADPMLSMVAGSVLFGLAVAVLYHNNASSGGTSIPPLIMKKYLKLNTSLGLFLTDGIVVLLCLLVFSVDSFFYAVFSILITSATMSYVESGLNKKKLVYIISDQHEAIARDILAEVGKGVTAVPVVGAYRRKQLNMLMVALDSRRYQQLLAVVNRHDGQAFMITDTVTDVHGRGFTYESGSV